MQIITPAQCRAARALLNWSQPKLAERCDIHVQTISNFEKESGSPSKSTLEKITGVLILADIEFGDDDGVRRKSDRIKQYQGTDGFRLFMDDIYETAKMSNDEICLLNADPDLWIKFLGDTWHYNTHVPRMESLLGKINVRIAIKKGNYNFIAAVSANIAGFLKKIWNKNSFYTYGDKIGFMNFENDDVEIFVLKHKNFAESFRFLFNLVWDQYSIIPDVPDHKPLK